MINGEISNISPIRTDVTGIGITREWIRGLTQIESLPRVPHVIFIVVVCVIDSIAVPWNIRLPRLPWCVRGNIRALPKQLITAINFFIIPHHADPGSTEGFFDRKSTLEHL